MDWTKKVTQARKGLGTNSVGLATELSLVSRLLQKVIPKKFVPAEMATDLKLGKYSTIAHSIEIEL